MSGKPALNVEIRVRILCIPGNHDWCEETNVTSGVSEFAQNVTNLEILKIIFSTF